MKRMLIIISVVAALFFALLHYGPDLKKVRNDYQAYQTKWLLPE